MKHLTEFEQKLATQIVYIKMLKTKLKQLLSILEQYDFNKYIQGENDTTLELLDGNFKISKLPIQALLSQFDHLNSPAYDVHLLQFNILHHRVDRKFEKLTNPTDMFLYQINYLNLLTNETLNRLKTGLNFIDSIKTRHSQEGQNDNDPPEPSAQEKQTLQAIAQLINAVEHFTHNKLKITQVDTLINNLDRAILMLSRPDQLLALISNTIELNKICFNLLKPRSQSAVNAKSPTQQEWQQDLVQLLSSLTNRLTLLSSQKDQMIILAGALQSLLLFLPIQKNAHLASVFNHILNNKYLKNYDLSESKQAFLQCIQDYNLSLKEDSKLYIFISDLLAVNLKSQKRDVTRVKSGTF